MEEAPVDLKLNLTSNPTQIFYKNATKVVTDNNAHASYQLESERYTVKPGTKVRIPYDITVEQGGRMSLGLLNTQRNNWYDTEVILGPGHYKNFFERIVPEGETETSLVFRNYHLENPGQSTFTINKVKIEI